MDMDNRIGFNKPFLTGKEMHYIYDAVYGQLKLSGNGKYTKKCQEFFEKKYAFQKTLLTTSCTDALEMVSILLNIQEGDEIIMPSYTFVSTSNAFVLRGAKIVFADSYSNNPNIDPSNIESLITEKTKVIVLVHYAGIACDMDKILAIAKKHNLYVVEDAAQAIDSFYKEQALGGIGHFGTFSFHETKNIISGEGGALIINDEQFIQRSEIIWEKGTNRAAFFRGEVDKYGWVDLGSSFLPSEIIAAFLYAQLENIQEIQKRRKHLWNYYRNALEPLAKKGYFHLPFIPEYSSNNAHLFYIVCHSLEERSALIQYLREKNITAVFHYLSLHKSPFYKKKHNGRSLPNCDRFSDCLLRLPLFYELETNQQLKVVEVINDFFEKRKVSQKTNQITHSFDN